MVFVDKSSKSSLYNNSEEILRDHLGVMKKQSKYMWRMMSALRDSTKMKDLLRGSSARLKNG